MNPEDARAILRGRGLCGRISLEPVEGTPYQEQRACIRPLGHDLGAHEASKEDIAAELAIANEKIADLHRQHDTMSAHLTEIAEQLKERTNQKDAAYTERNRLVAALSPWPSRVAGRRSLHAVSRIRSGMRGSGDTTRMTSLGIRSGAPSSTS